MPRGGKRHGAGRPKGSKDPHTLEREVEQAKFDQRVMRNTDRLFNAQLASAEGCTFLFRQEIDKKTGKRGKVERVTSEHEIKEFLEQHGADGSGQAEDGSAWYFMATERPNADAADRLLNRGLGKPVERYEHSGSVATPGVVTFLIAQQVGAENRT